MSANRNHRTGNAVFPSLLRQINLHFKLIIDMPIKLNASDRLSVPQRILVMYMALEQKSKQFFAVFHNFNEISFIGKN